MKYNLKVIVMDDNIQLKNNWNLWYHSINDTSWTKKSYHKIYTITNLYDYQYVINTFRQEHYQNGMFFLMKENIFPNWEDPYNRNGGCLSFKIPSKDILNEWNILLLNSIVGEIFNDSDELNGISISPKKEFNIIKIWIKNDDFDYSKHFEKLSDYLDLDNVLYKKHDIH